jgi:hypothetical protein
MKQLLLDMQGNGIQNMIAYSSKEMKILFLSFIDPIVVVFGKNRVKWSIEWMNNCREIDQTVQFIRTYFIK